MEETKQNEPVTEAVEKEIPVEDKQKNKKTKRPWWILLGLVVAALVVLGLFLAWWYLIPVAKIGNERIYRPQVSAESKNLSGFYQHNEDDDSLKNLTGKATSDLVENKIVEMEAARLGFDITDEEIEKRISEIALDYESVDDYYENYKNTYGWDRDYIKNNVRISLLKDKLESTLLNGRSVEFVFVRYDIYSSQPNLPEAKIAQIYEEIKSGKDLKTIGSELQAVPDWFDYRSGYDLIEDLKDSTAQDTFEGTEDWPEIKKLNTVGEYTQVVKSGGGYFAVYKLTKINNSAYDTWEDFIKDYKSKNGYKEGLVLSYLAEPLSVGEAYAICDHSDLKTSASGTCCILKDSAQSRHYSKLSGTVVDATNANLKISGVKVWLDRGSNPGHLCSTESESKWGPDTTGSDGKYTLPTDGQRKINCWFHWKLTATKNGYNDYTYPDYNFSPNGIAKTLNIKMTPFTPTLTIVKNGTGTGTVRVDEKNFAGNTLDCGSNCTRKYEYGQVITVKAVAGSGSVFAAMTGDTSSNPALTCNKSVSDPTCTVRMGKNRTITVTFNLTTNNTYYWCPAGATSCSSQVGSCPAGQACVTSASECNCPAATEASLSCTFKPASGVLPLVTQLKIVPKNAETPYTVQLSKNGLLLSSFDTDKDSNIISLKEIGSYVAKVKARNIAAEVKCESEVTVKNPSAGSGGEVAP